MRRAAWVCYGDAEAWSVVHILNVGANALRSDGYPMLNSEPLQWDIIITSTLNSYEVQ